MAAAVNTTAATGAIAIYAELLLNIRRINVTATLPSPAIASTTNDAPINAPEPTTARISEDARNLTVTHLGVSKSLTLPARVAGGAQLLDGIVPGATTLSWRLGLAPDAGSEGEDALLADVATWGAAELRASEAVSCRWCGVTVVAEGKLKEWKDLPSEGWAEMMEFWHCHKPVDRADEEGDGGYGALDGHGHANGHEHGKHGGGKAGHNSLASRGYGANSIVSSQKGIGLVNLNSFLFSEEDCEGILFSLSTAEEGARTRGDLVQTVALEESPKTLNVFCHSCRARIGYFDFRSDAVILFKWHLALKKDLRLVAAFSSPSISTCLSASLASVKARTGSSMALLLPMFDDVRDPPLPTDDGKVLHLQVFNAGVTFSSTRLMGGELVRPATKILYRLVDRDDADRMLEKVDGPEQEVMLPREAIQSVRDLLEISNKFLPASDRMFMGKKVGLLGR